MAKKTTASKKKVSAPGAREPMRVIILDSHAILHRAYHALPDFTSSSGEPTGALYGLVAMLIRINNELKPDYVIAARDLPGGTFRHEKFEAYKATRQKTDDALIVQLNRAPAVFEAFGIPVYEKPGFEADDILGTIASALSRRGDVATIIASGDMDALQLVDPRVVVYTMRKGINDTVLFDEEAVRERYGFSPAHVIDYKALRGDPSDNIPGVRGIGEKTATDLIQKFGSIETIYDTLGKDPEALAKAGIKPRIVQLLSEQKQQAFFSKELATIHTSVPIDFALPKTQWHLSDHHGTIAALCDELEFRSLKERLGVTSAIQAGVVGEKSAARDVATVDQEALKRTALALWLLHSDTTNPTLEDILQYANTDDFETAQRFIFSKLHDTPEVNRVYAEIELPLLPVVERMNSDGVSVDVALLKKLAKEYGKGLAEIASRIYAHAGHEFNINSPKQLGDVIYDELKITSAKTKKTATGARTTREEELVKIKDLHPIIADVLAYRELQKLLSTYIEKIPDLVSADGRLRAEFLQAGTTTGRMGSRDPNLQNIPIKSEHGRRIRTAFTAEAGNVLASIDYSQIELRIAAGLSGDKKLIDIFRGGGDVHTAASSEVFGVPAELVDKEMRRRAKVINFGILYGMGVNALRGNLGTDVSWEDAARYLDEYFKNFSGLARYIESTKAEVTRTGYTETLFGRRRYFPGIKSSLPGMRAQAERMAINAPIQGTQSDIIKKAMVAADATIERNGWRADARLVLQVHDELVYEVSKAKADEIVPVLRDCMESVVSTDMLAGVPIEAEAAIGENWGTLHKVAR